MVSETCPACGSGYSGPRRRGCKCPPATVIENAAGFAFQTMTARHDDGMKAPQAATYAALEYGCAAGDVLASMNAGVRDLLDRMERTVVD